MGNMNSRQIVVASAPAKNIVYIGSFAMKRNKNITYITLKYKETPPGWSLRQLFKYAILSLSFVLGLGIRGPNLIFLDWVSIRVYNGV